MSSPYRAGAIVPPSGGLPPNTFALTQEEYDAFLVLEASIPLLSHLPPKIYEPVMVAGELLISASGDCLMAWGGEYAS